MAIDISFTPFASGTSSTALERISSVDPRLTRTNYFDGRLLKASDLTRDQIYLDERAREIGRVLGSGVAYGLDLALAPDAPELLLTAGSGIAPSGRVLELAGRDLSINLGNSALIADLNQGYHHRLRRGLYAVVLQYAEVCDSSAEAYPADLASQRGIRCGTFAEGVELALVPLEIPLPQSDALGARAALVPDLIGANGAAPFLPEEALPLGLLAIEYGLPQWLDLGLLRRPLRPSAAPDALQQDLATHYEELLAAARDQRAGTGLGEAFAAGHYFRLLPPYGRLPRAAIDPVRGRQGYFPDGWEVSIAPIRHEDLGAVLSESSMLAPMDLERDADADIMVLVPMDNAEFALYARQLESDPRAAVLQPDNQWLTGRLLHLDRLKLRLYPRPPVHQINTDADAWSAIMAALPSNQDLVFVRRPPRAAETSVSAVILARGFAVPAVEAGQPSLSLEDLEAQIEQLQELLGESRARADELERQLDALQNEDPDARVAALQAQVTALEAQVTALRAQLADAERDAEALAQAQEQVRALTAQITTLQAAVTTAEAATAAERSARTQAEAELAACREALNNQPDGETLPSGVRISAIAAIRSRSDPALIDQATEVERLLEDRHDEQHRVIRLASIIERGYDEVFWVTLRELVEADRGNIERLHNALIERIDAGESTGRIIEPILEELGVDRELSRRWRQLRDV